VLKDYESHNNAKYNSNQAVSDLVEICIGSEALEDAHEKRERNLQTRVSSPLAACCHPSCKRRSRRGEKGQRNDALHVWHEIDDGEETEETADRAADESEACFADGCSGAFERDK